MLLQVQTLYVTGNLNQDYQRLCYRSDQCHLWCISKGVHLPFRRQLAFEKMRQFINIAWYRSKVHTQRKQNDLTAQHTCGVTYTSVSTQISAGQQFCSAAAQDWAAFLPQTIRCYTQQWKGHLCQVANLATELTASYIQNPPVALLHEAADSRLLPVWCYRLVL